MNPLPWTGGHYRVFRLLLGAYLAQHFVLLLPWGRELFSNQGMIASAEFSPLMGIVPNPLLIADSPTAVAALLAAGAIAGGCVAVGKLDRTMGLVAAAILAWLYQRNPLIANPSLPVVGWLLVAHSLVPRLPSRRQTEGGHQRPWQLPASIWAAAWLVLAVAYSYSGYTKLLSPSWVDGSTVELVLNNPLARDHALTELLLTLPAWVLQLITWLVLYVELLFAPLALCKRLRPWLWTLMLLAQFGFLTLLNFADLTFPMLLIHLLTFDPRWFKPARGQFTLFYDGQCAFCHRWGRLVLREDPTRRIQLAPLQGVTAIAQLPIALRQPPYQSMVLSDGTALYTEGDAVRRLLKQLGGGWGLLSWLLRPLPRALLNRSYRWIAGNRYRWFGRANSTCLLPDDTSSNALLP